MGGVSRIQARTPRSEIDHRIQDLRARMENQGIDGALIIQNVDLFYFCGSIQQAHLYVPVDGEPLLMVRKSIERAQAESPIQKIIPLASPKKIQGLLKANGLRVPRKLGLELDVLPANLYLMYDKIFEDSELVDIAHIIRLIRAVKSDYELDIIRHAAQMSDEVFAYVKELLDEGISEIELAGAIEGYARKLGHQGIIRMRRWGNELFYGHLMTGSSAAIPSYLSSPTGGPGANPAVAQGAGFTQIHRNEPVLVDYVFAYNGYMVDQTRIFCLGELPEDLIKAHQVMLHVQTQIKKEAKTGVRAGLIYDLALELTRASGYADNFMGVGPQRIRFVGHGVGLELDEYPFLARGQDMELQDRMVIAVEPKLILPGKGVVGIENTHMVTDSGLHQLTNFEENIVTKQI